MSYTNFKSLPAEIQQKIDAGRIFKVRFLRRNEKKGEERVREMFARTGVTAFLKGAAGKGAAYDFSDKGLIPVYDMQESQFIAESIADRALTDATEIFNEKGKAYRSVPCERIITIKVGPIIWDLSVENTDTHILTPEEILGKKILSKALSISDEETKARYLKVCGFEKETVTRVLSAVKLSAEVLHSIYMIEPLDTTHAIANSIGLMGDIF